MKSLGVSCLDHLVDYRMIMIIYSTDIRLASVAKVIGQLSKWGKSNQASDCDGKSLWKQKMSSVQTDLVTTGSKDFQARNSYAIRSTGVFLQTRPVMEPGPATGRT